MTTHRDPETDDHGASRPPDHGGRVRTLLVLGASGDLAGRLLLPGFAELVASGDVGGPSAPISLVGAGVEDWSAEQWQDRLRESFAAAEDADGASGGPPQASAEGRAAVAAVRRASTYVMTDVTDAGQLSAALARCEAPVAIHFALPPAITARACDALAGLDLPEGTRLVLEKPFGHDEESARALNRVVAGLVPEDRVHRVDHFLGRSTVLNALGVRFANRLFEPVWSAEHVERVDVVYDEDLALEGRARYYDHAGALVDMIQSHLLQVAALFLMDPPATLDERDLRDAKATVLRATRLWGTPQDSSRRARYGAGRMGERDLPAYAAEDGVDPELGTETLAEVVLAVDTWRWAGVPVRLRSGKALGRARKEVVITFKPVPHLPVGLTGEAHATRVRFGFSPDALAVDLAVNGPGDPFELDSATLTAQMGAPDLPAYGQVLRGVLTGDPTLSVRGDTAEDCWRILDPVLTAWRDGAVELEEYPAGSDGPPPTDAFPAVGAPPAAPGAAGGAVLHRLGGRAVGSGTYSAGRGSTGRSRRT